MKIDSSAFLGDYPFRGLPDSTPESWLKLAQRYQVDRAVVCAYNEIFWENNFEAARRLARQIEGFDHFVHFPAVNPVYPHQLADLPALLRDTEARGVRLFPAYHGYRLWDAPVLELFDLMAEADLPVQIFCEIQDFRLQWLFKVPVLSQVDLEWLLCRPQAPCLLLSGMTVANILGLRDRLVESSNVWIDLARASGPVFYVEQLVQELGAHRLVMGSLWPLQMMAPSLRPIDDAAITPAERKAIMGDNWEHLAGSGAKNVSAPSAAKETP